MKGVLAVLTLVGVLAPAAAAAAPLPYTDPAVSGSLALCDRNGRTVDHGSLQDAPFVWTAIASAPAPPPYDAPGRTATLFAFQPRPGVAPGQWSGELLTASTRYTDVAHPTAVATAGDDPLATFVGDFPPQWDGLIELRLILGAPGQPPRTGQYAATDIRVSGTTWSVVRGGGTCTTGGHANSIENLLLPASGLTTLPHRASTLPARAAASTAPHVSASSSLSPSSSSSSSSSSSNRAVARVVVVFVTLALCSAWVVYVRRRHAARA